MKHAFHKKVERKGGGSSWRHPSRNSPRSKTYLPTTTMTNEFAFILPRRSPGAGGSKSAAGMKMLCVFKSRPMVRNVLDHGVFVRRIFVVGFLFVPLTMAAYVGLPDSKSNAAAGLINFTRNQPIARQLVDGPCRDGLFKKRERGNPGNALPDSRVGLSSFGGARH